MFDMEFDSKAFADRIRQRSAEIGEPIKAVLAGIRAASAMSAWDAGKTPTADVVVALALKLRISPMWLLTGEFMPGDPGYADGQAPQNRWHCVTLPGGNFYLEFSGEVTGAQLAALTNAGVGPSQAKTQ